MSSMRREDVQILDRTRVYEGYFKIDRVRLRHPLFAGGMGREIVRESSDRGHAVAVMPYDPVRDEIVLIEQFRIGAFDAGLHPWLVEVVAGIIDEGETVEEVARREAVEEMGRPVGDLVGICEFQPGPGAITERITLFLGRVDATGVEGIHGLADEGEDIRVFAVSVDEARAMFEAGRIANSIVIIALQWLLLNRDAVRERWKS